MALLRDLFPNKLIIRLTDISWPPRSPDLTPMDFFPWGYLKSKVYETTPPTISALKENIVREVNSIPTSHRVSSEWRALLKPDSKNVSDVMVNIQTK